MLTTAAVAIGSGALSLAYTSIFEWTVHRFLYHPPETWPVMSLPHGEHHDLLYPASSYYEWTRRYRAVQPYWLETAYVVAHLPIAALIATVSVPAAVSIVSMMIAYAVLSHYVHPLVHLRTGWFYERTALFKWLLARHIWHHRDIGVNFNIVLPLGDWLFGTSHERKLRLGGGEAAVELESGESPRG